MTDKEKIRARNMELHGLIADRLETVGLQWAEAWRSLIVTRGKRYGCVRLNKPPHNWRGTRGRAGMLWEVWRQYRGQLSARRLGVGPAAMSMGGLICSTWSVDDDTKQEALEVAIDAIAAAMRQATEKNDA